MKSTRRDFSPRRIRRHFAVTRGRSSTHVEGSDRDSADKMEKLLAPKKAEKDGRKRRRKRGSDRAQDVVDSSPDILALVIAKKSDSIGFKKLRSG